MWNVSKNELKIIKKLAIWNGFFGVNCRIGSDLWWCPDYVALTWIRFLYARAVKNPMDLSNVYGLVLVVCCSHSYWVFFLLFRLLSVSDTHIQSVNTIGLFERINAALFRICDILTSHIIKCSEEGRKHIDTRKEQKYKIKEKKFTTYKNWNSEGKDPKCGAIQIIFDSHFHAIHSAFIMAVCEIKLKIKNQFA